MQALLLMVVDSKLLIVFLSHNRALEAGASGGALHALNGADVLLENCDLQSNLAAQFGGGFLQKTMGPQYM